MTVACIGYYLDDFVKNTDINNFECLHFLFYLKLYIFYILFKANFPRFELNMDFLLNLIYYFLQKVGGGV